MQQIYNQQDLRPEKFCLCVDGQQAAAKLVEKPIGPLRKDHRKRHLKYNAYFSVSNIGQNLVKVFWVVFTCDFCRELS